jgi:hypothetical protein
MIPPAGLLVAALVLFLRRPGALLDAQLWAEDGRIFFENVYQLGLGRSIILPQAGYFQTLPNLVAWLAARFPISSVPTVFASVGLLAESLPVALILSSRARTISPRLWVRVAMAAVYLVLPVGQELDITTVNAQWFLAIGAFIVLMYAPPSRPAWRILDASVLLLSGLTGPFVIVLAVVALLRRVALGRSFIPDWELGLVLACAALQGAALILIAPQLTHDAAVETRPSPPLGATPGLAARLIGGRTLLGALLGPRGGLQAAPWIDWLMIAVATLLAGGALRARRQEVVLGLLVGGFVLAGALSDPSGVSLGAPAWPQLLAPGSNPRYYLIPELAWLGLLAWACGRITARTPRALAVAAILALIAFSATRHWSFPPAPRSSFAATARAFERARPGTSVRFVIDPPSWSMTLVKR